MSFDESPSPEELREAVRLTFRSEGWTKVIVPLLQEKMAAARGRLENRHQSLEEIRFLQGQISAWRDFAEDPIESFKVTK